MSNECERYIYKLDLSEEEIKALLILIYNEIWDESHGEEKVSLIRKLTQRLEVCLTKNENKDVE